MFKYAIQTPLSVLYVELQIVKICERKMQFWITETYIENHMFLRQ